MEWVYSGTQHTDPHGGGTKSLAAEDMLQTPLALLPRASLDQSREGGYERWRVTGILSFHLTQFSQ